LAGIWRHNEYFDSGLFRRQMKPIVGYVYVAILSIVQGLLQHGSLKNVSLAIIVLLIKDKRFKTFSIAHIAANRCACCTTHIVLIKIVVTG